jgi:hypothetical protein
MSNYCALQDPSNFATAFPVNPGGWESIQSDTTDTQWGTQYYDPDDPTNQIMIGNYVAVDTSSGAVSCVENGGNDPCTGLPIPLIGNQLYTNPGMVAPSWPLPAPNT